MKTKIQSLLKNLSAVATVEEIDGAVAFFSAATRSYADKTYQCEPERIFANANILGNMVVVTLRWADCPSFSTAINCFMSDFIDRDFAPFLSSPATIKYADKPRRNGSGMSDRFVECRDGSWCIVEVRFNGDYNGRRHDSYSYDEMLLSAAAGGYEPVAA